jgi:hypothetical protein
MNCRQARQYLLSPADDPAVGTTRAAGEAEAHLRSCAECRAWRAAEEQLDRALLGVPQEDPPADFKANVMRRVRALAAERRAEVARRPAGPPWWRRPAFVAQAACAAAALALLLSPAGLAALSDAARWAGALDPAAHLAVTPPPLEGGTGLLGAVRLRGQDVVLVSVMCGLGLLGNLLLLSRGARQRGRRGLKCLLPLAAAAAILASGGLVQAAAAQDPAGPAPPWRNLGETSDTFRFVLLIALTVMGGCGLTAVALCVRAYCRRLTATLDRVVAQRSGVYQFLIGLFNFVLLFGLAILFAQYEPLRILTLLILVGMGVLSALGFAAWIRAVGRDVLALGGGGRAELACALAGGAVLVLALLLPIVGQILWAGLLVQCLGTALLGLVQRLGVGVERDAAVPVNDQG